jgi:hypothetical protein
MTIESSLAVLARTAPPGKLRFRTYGATRHEILRLCAALGVPCDAEPIYNVGAANARIRELEGMIAAKTAPVPAAATVTTTPPAQAAPVATAPSTYTKSLPDYLALGADARAQFAADGGQLSRNDFDRLTPAARMAHCRHGGGISDFVPNGRRSGGEPKETNSGN